MAGGNLFDVLNNLVKKDCILTEDELADFEPFIANKYLHFSGFTKQAQILNKYTFVFDKYSWYLLAFKLLPRCNVFWKYVKKPENEKKDFFVLDTAKYFKVSYKRAEEYLGLLKLDDKLKLCRKFGYDDATVKKLGFEIAKKIEVKKEIEKTLKDWW